jgi:hypothetical protein
MGQALDAAHAVASVTYLQDGGYLDELVRLLCTLCLDELVCEAQPGGVCC